MKFYILQKQIAGGPTFTHPWTNDNDDFFDGHKYYEYTDSSNNKYYGVEAFLMIEGYTSGDEPIYKWVEIDSSRIQRTNLDTAIMSIDDETRQESDNYFIKCVSDNELPLYYYNIEVTEPSNQNNETISYALVLQLDYWSTFGFYFNEYMVHFPSDLLFLRKHANRFIFDPFGKGFYFDYLLQPYLARGEFKGYQLIRDLTEEGLNLEEWKYINTDAPSKNVSFGDWWTNTYYPWLLNPWAGALWAASDTQKTYPTDKGVGTPVEVKKGTDYWQNVHAYTFEYVPDWYYNSNGLYRWLVLKTGKYIKNFNPTTGEEIKSNNFIKRTHFDLSRYNYTPSTELLNFEKKSIGERDIDTARSTFDIQYNDVSGIRYYEINVINSYPLSQTYVGEKFYYNSNEGWLIWDNQSTKNQWIEFPTTITLQDGSEWEVIFYLAAVDTSTYSTITREYPVSCTKAHEDKQDGIIDIDTWHRISYESEYTLTPKGTQLQTRNIVCKNKSTGQKITTNKEWNAYIETKLANNNEVQTRIHFDFAVSLDNFNIKSLKLEVQHEGETWYTARQYWKPADEGKDATLSYPVTADTLILMPVEKTLSIPAVYSETVPSYKATSKTIYTIFNSIDITPGSQSFIGSLINEIPIEILALASRKNVLEGNTYGYPTMNLTSCREAELSSKYKPCPEDIQLLIASQGTSESEITGYIQLPCLFSDLSYIPVTIARSPLSDTKECLGGNNFINTYYDLLSNNDLTKYNTMYSDPIMYSPDIWQWKYLIDGTNEITIIGSYFNFYNMINLDSWEININVAMSNSTYYKVDLGKLKSEAYPFSKAFSELIGHDNRKFTQYTEDYYNWLQNNQSTYDAAKVGFEINAKRAFWEQGISGAVNNASSGAIIGGTVGATEGMAGGPAGALIGAGIGAVAGVGLGIGGSALAKKYNKQLFDLQWKTRFSNMASRPLTAVENGFATGSLNYASWENPQYGDRQLFRTYRPSLLDRSAIWYDFCWKGYNYYGMAKFKEYDNRKMFNYLQVDTSLDALLIKHLKEYMCKESLLFSQTKFIDWFLSKLSKGIRLFKCDFNAGVETYESYQWTIIVLNNIENDYQEPYTSNSSDSIILKTIEQENPNLYELIK